MSSFLLASFKICYMSFNQFKKLKINSVFLLAWHANDKSCRMVSWTEPSTAAEQAAGPGSFESALTAAFATAAAVAADCPMWCSKNSNPSRSQTLDQHRHWLDPNRILLWGQFRQGTSCLLLNPFPVRIETWVEFEWSQTNRRLYQKYQQGQTFPIGTGSLVL